MMNKILPIVLLAASVWIVIGFIRPQFTQAEAVQILIEERRKTLESAELVIERRDRLMAQYASISTAQVRRLTQLLPDRIDSIRAILEFSALANAYGLKITSIEAGSGSGGFGSAAIVGGNVPGGIVGSGIPGEDGTYQVGGEEQRPAYESESIRLKFSGTYQNFVSFLVDVEYSLRLSDLESLIIDARASEEAPDVYEYSVSFRSYKYVP